MSDQFINSPGLSEGAVTSIAFATTLSGLSVSGSPITGSGTITLSGTLGVASGGTNSVAALSNNRVMVSSGGAIVEAAAITVSRALVSDSNGIPVAATTSTTEINYVAGVTSAIQTQIDGKQPLNANLTALAALNATAGYLVETAANTFARRTLTGTANQVIITNGDGTIGNPVFSLPQNIDTAAMVTFEGITLSGNISGAPSLTGSRSAYTAITFTDNTTAGSGTATALAMSSETASIIAAANSSVTTTTAYTRYISGAPQQGSNQTLTNSVAFAIDTVNVKNGQTTTPTNSYGLKVAAQTGASSNFTAVFTGGSVGIGTATPGAVLDLTTTASASMTGTVTVGAGSTAVVGTGTLFTTELKVGDAIGINGQVSTVSVITDNLNLTLGAAHTNADTNVAPTRDPSILWRAINSANNSRMVINRTGYVGFGVTTPLAKVDISGVIFIDNLSVLPTDKDSYIGIIRTDGTGSAPFDNAGSIIYRPRVSSTAGRSSHIFYTGSPTAERMRINETGNVGIGVSSPATNLDVNGFINWNGLKRVSTQFDKTTSTALADITGLSVTLVAGKTYRFRVVLFCDADVTGGQKYAMAGTATATAIIYQITTISNASNLNVITSRQTALAGSAGQAGSTGNYTAIEGLITVNAGGTLTTQFAQNASSGTSSILVGSHMIVHQIQ